MRDDLQSDHRTSSGSDASPLRKILLCAAAAFVLYLLGWWLYVAFIQSDADKIRAALAEAAQAARERRPSGVSAILSEDFHFKSPLRDLGKKDADDALFAVLMNMYRHIEISMSPQPIPVELDAKDPKRAKAKFRARVQGKASDEAPWEELNPRAGGTAFDATFKKTDQGWKIVELELSREAP